MTITVCPVTLSFAAEIGDVDLSRALEPTDLTAIKDAFTTYAVLIFPDQHLSQDQHLDFAKTFGPLETTIALYRKDAKLRVRKEFADVSNLDLDMRYGAKTRGNAFFSSATGCGIPTAHSGGCPRGRRCSMRARSRRSAATLNLPTNAPPTTRCPKT
ncbi:MAG: TauD/TfdA family dioxygenase [Pseudolabrys sp.]